MSKQSMPTMCDEILFTRQISELRGGAGEGAHIGGAGGATRDRALSVRQALSHEDTSAEGSQVGIVAGRHHRHRVRAAAKEVAQAAPRHEDQ